MTRAMVIHIYTLRINMGNAAERDKSRSILDMELCSFTIFSKS